MKILKKPNQWWLKAVYKCQTCETEFKVEKSDKVQIINSGADAAAMVHCPSCSRGVWVNTPIKPKSK